MKKVVEINIARCPHCFSKMYIMESQFNLYAFNDQGTAVEKLSSKDATTDLVCSNPICGFHISAVHSMYGILPKNHEKIEKHNKDLEEGKRYRGYIGYVE